MPDEEIKRQIKEIADNWIDSIDNNRDYFRIYLTIRGFCDQSDVVTAPIYIVSFLKAYKKIEDRAVLFIDYDIFDLEYL